MKRRLPASPLSRRNFLGQLTAVSAALASPRTLWAAARNRVGDALPWSNKKSPLMTQWSSEVDPKRPHPLYPRPQMVREEWVNLNGLWEYQPGTAAGEAAPFGTQLSGSILVPYPVESALSGVMEHHDRLWYRRELNIPATWHGKQILLHFGAIDFESEVFVNGKSVGVHRGGYDPFSYDVTSFLSGGGKDELIVRVWDPTESGGQPRGKQNTRPRGITYTPTTGIWQTVWMEPVETVSIESLTMVPDIDRSELMLTVSTSKPKTGSMVEVVVKAGGSVLTKATIPADGATAIAVPKARLWSPDNPFLYTLDLTLKQGQHTTDKVASYFGMRKTSVGDFKGQKKLLLNNEFVFQLGPLDQGFWPDGIYTAPTDEALKSDIVQMKAMGFNMVRKHIKVEPARWYYWADTLGLLVWQDMPSANSYPGNQFVPPPVDKPQFEAELRRMVETHKNSPCIVVWTIFNEGQGQFDTGRLVDVVRSLDSSRPINEASGGTITGAGDLNDIHSYPEPAVRPSNGKQAMVCGEFGGIGFLVPTHSWVQEGHGYVEVDTATDLLYLYAEFMDWVRELRDENNLSAVVYTELTDVMTEINGVLTYDRIPKIAPEKLKLVNTFNFPAPKYKTVVPTSQESPQEWKYTFNRPADEWTQKGFNDSQWSSGAGPFGNGDHVGTKWSGSDIWLRKHFNPGALTEQDLENLVVKQFYQGRAEILVNGVPASTQRGNNRSYEGRYEHRPLLQAVRQAIVPNAENVIAVHCHGDGTKQFCDAGLSVRAS